MSIHLVQDLTFETDTLQLLEAVLVTALEVTGYRHVFWPTRPDLEDGHPSDATNAALSWHREFSKEAPKKNYYPIAGVGRSKPGRPYLEDALARDAGEARAMIMARVAAADRDAFAERTGEGPFATFDGLVRVGYRLHGGTRGPAALALSLCHIYYPK